MFEVVGKALEVGWVVVGAYIDRKGCGCFS